jgi:hypothetical protein
MLHVYAGLDLIECDRRARRDLPPDSIDLSKTSSSNFAEALLTVFRHHAPGKSSIYAGFMDPLLMLSPQDEARCRRVFRAFDVYLVCSNPMILPFSWKNGLKSLVLIGQHTTRDAETAPLVDNGRPAHVPPQV